LELFIPIGFWQIKKVVAGTTFDTNLLQSRSKDVAMALPLFFFFSFFSFDFSCRTRILQEKVFIHVSLLTLYIHIPICPFLFPIIHYVVGHGRKSRRYHCVLYPIFQPSLFLLPSSVHYFMMMKACSTLVLCVMRASFSRRHMI
jgi:hypothetical protein